MLIYDLWSVSMSTRYCSIHPSIRKGDLLLGLFWCLAFSLFLFSFSFRWNNLILSVVSPWTQSSAQLLSLSWDLSISLCSSYILLSIPTLSPNEDNSLDIFGEIWIFSGLCFGITAKSSAGKQLRSSPRLVSPSWSVTRADKEVTRSESFGFILGKILGLTLVSCCRLFSDIVWRVSKGLTYMSQTTDEVLLV